MSVPPRRPDHPRVGRENADGIARSIIRFVENVIPGHHGDTHATLKAMHNKHLVLTHATHSAPGGHH
ncbi:MULTISPECIES: hypothetical protein [unclassified Streptomyces]|uniref:hypothetical protein n=1 Tax=unclassified Streptomyces TaxID=2593676 RepID=UPI002E298835|nr:hypothetical protein [Streptomyces sp. NBC_01429]